MEFVIPLFFSLPLLLLILALLIAQWVKTPELLMFIEEEKKQILVSIGLAVVLSLVLTVYQPPLEEALFRAEEAERGVSELVPNVLTEYYDRLWRSIYTVYSARPWGYFPLGYFLLPHFQMVPRFLYFLSPLTYLLRAFVLLFSALRTEVNLGGSTLPVVVIFLSAAVSLRPLPLIREGADTLLALLISAYFLLPLVYSQLSPVVSLGANHLVRFQLSGEDPVEISCSAEPLVPDLLTPCSLVEVVGESLVPPLFSTTFSLSFAYALFKGLREI